MPNLTRRKNQSKRKTIGQRKTSKPADENASIERAQTSRAVKPRPVKPTSKVFHELSNVDDKIEEAAIALVSLHKPKPLASGPDSEPPEEEEYQVKSWDRQYHEMYHPNSPYPGSDAEGPSAPGEDEDELDSSEKEEEVNELESDSDLDELLSIPADSPQKTRQPHPASNAPFSIPIEVPYKNATRDLTGITSASTFNYVLHQIGKKMDATPSQLAAIGYIPSYKPKNPKPVPKLLEDEAAWAKLVQDVQQYISTFASKKGAAKSVKPFVITIVDTRGPRVDKAEKESKAGSLKKSDGFDREAALNKTESRQLEALRRIEAHHMCQEHKKPCLVQLNGSHYQYTNGDLAKWSMLLVDGKALLGEPPQELNLTDAYKRQHKAKANMNETLREQVPFTASEFWQNMAGFMMMQNMAGRAAFGNPMSPMLPASTSTGSVMPAIPATPLGGMKRALPAISAPSLIEWTADLITDPTRKESNLGQYLDVFDDNDIKDLEDLVSFSANELVELTGMKIGLAKRALRYAENDLEALRQAKQARLE